jgi:hypothetical protein
MNKTKLYGTLALALLAGAAACDRSAGNDGDGQGLRTAEQAPMAEQAMDPQIMASVMEIQQLQAELEPIQRQALEDEDLARQLEALQLQVETAMREEGSELFGRIDAFQDEMAAAEAAGDQERMQSLMMQAQEIQQEVHSLQVAMFQRPEISEPFERFEAAHRARMIELDPKAGELIDRIDQLMDGLPR